VTHGLAAFLDPLEQREEAGQHLVRLEPQPLVHALVEPGEEVAALAVLQLAQRQHPAARVFTGLHDARVHRVVEALFPEAQNDEEHRPGRAQGEIDLDQRPVELREPLGETALGAEPPVAVCPFEDDRPFDRLSRCVHSHEHT
jgi:hypothetical protein